MTTKEPGSAAGRRIRVEVTAEDIAKGRRRHGCDCMIALAARRAGVAVETVQPWNWEGSINGHGPHGRVSTPGGECHIPFEAAEIARRWDDGHAVEPFAFDLELP